MPAIVGETQLSSFEHFVCNFPDGCRSEGFYTLNQTLNAFRLLPVHVILCFSPELEVQRVQIRRMRWPIDWGSLTDYPTIELFSEAVDVSKIQAVKILCKNLKWPLIMKQFSYQVYEYSRWFRNGSHFKMSNRKETRCIFL